MNSAVRACAPALTTLLFIIAACGGTAPTGTPTTRPDGATQAPGSATQQPAGPTATPGGAQGTPSGNQPPGTGTACSLLTGAEVASVLGAEITAMQDVPAGEVSSLCLYATAANPGVALALWRVGGRELFEIYSFGDELEEVGGLGDGALWEPVSASLIVVKGEALFTVVAGSGAETLGQRLEWAKQLAAYILGRL